MNGSPRGELTLSDLEKVVEAVAMALPNENQPRQIAELAGLRDPPTVSGTSQSKDRWTPVFDAVLGESPEMLAALLKNIRGRIGSSRKSEIDHALEEMKTDCVYRVTRTSNLSLNDQIEDLSSAFPPETFKEPAERLRNTALGVRRLLMRPLLAETFLQLEKGLDYAIAEPEWLRIEPANQAVNVVTALDYLLTLMMTPDTTASQLVLGGPPGSDRTQGRTDEEAYDWLTRRRLDARGTAVREAMRLLVMLRREIAID